MCGVMLATIIFVLDLFKFPFTLNPFMRFPSYTNFIFATVSNHSSSSCCCSLSAVGPCRCSLTSSSWPLLVFLLVLLLFSRCFSASLVHIPYGGTILLYNKETVSLTLCSLSVSASRVTATCADTALYNFEIVFLKNEFIVLLKHFWERFWKFYGQKNDTMYRLS